MSTSAPLVVLICGGRAYSDRETMFRNLDAQCAASTRPWEVIHGGAPGADTLAGEWAAARKIRCTVYRADWKTHGKAAGMLRNQQMLDEGEPHLVIAFPGGIGTADMLRRAEAAGVPTVEYSPR